MIKGKKRKKMLEKGSLCKSVVSTSTRYLEQPGVGLEERRSRSLEGQGLEKRKRKGTLGETPHNCTLKV